MWGTVLLQKLFTIARSVVALDWSKVKVVSWKHGQCSLVKRLHGCAASSGTFITAESHVDICHYTPNKRCIFLTLTREMFDMINRHDWHYFWWFSVHQDFPLWNLPASSAIENSSQGEFYYPYVSFKDIDPIAPQSHCCITLSAEYSLKKALDKPLFGYQHLLWSDSLALEAQPYFGASFFIMYFRIFYKKSFLL